MTYAVEAFEWGHDYVLPDVQRTETKTLGEAKDTLIRLWENPKCFHVRVLNPPPSRVGSLVCNLVFMQSRPTMDRPIHIFFEPVKVPESVKAMRDPEEMNVLLVGHFYDEVPLKRLHLPADEFYFDYGGGMEKVKADRFSAGSTVLQLNNPEECIASAAFIPNKMSLILGYGDRIYFYLSKVEIIEERAELSFSDMIEDEDFSHGTS